MKYILSFLLLISVAFGQEKTELSSYGSNSGFLWMMVGAYPAWAGNDSLTGRSIKGYIEVKALPSNGIFSIEDILVSKGFTSSTDITGYLNWMLANNPRVKGISFSSKRHDSIRITGPVNFQGKLLDFDNVYIGGTGTVNNGTIKASMEQKIFGREVRAGENNFPNATVSVRWWGPDITGGTDTRFAFQQAHFTPGSINILAPAGTYRLNDSLWLRNVNANFTHIGVLRPSFSGKPMFSYGSHEIHASRRSLYVNAQSLNSMASIWGATKDAAKASQTIAYKLINTQHTFIDGNEISGFVKGVVLHSEGSGALRIGSVSNNITVTRIFNTQIAYHFTSDNQGWANDNRISKTYAGVQSSSPDVWRTFLLVNSADGYIQNANSVKDVSIELISNKAIPFTLEGSNFGTFEDFRFEGNSDTVAEISASPQSAFTGVGNVFRTTYSDHLNPIIKTLQTSNVYIDSRRKGIYWADYQTIWSWNAAGNSVMDGNNLYLNGINIFGSNGLVSANTTGAKAYSEHVEITSGTVGLGIEIDTRYHKNFLLKKQVEPGYEGRVFFQLLDEWGKIMTEREIGTYLQGVLWQTTFGGGWITGSSSENDLPFVVGNNVKAVRVSVVKASGINPRVKALQIINTHPHHRTPSFKYYSSGVDFATASAAPAVNSNGTYDQGRLIKNSAGGSWIATTGGTQRSLTGATIVSTASNNYGIVSGVSLDTVYVGEYIQQGSNVYRVTKKNVDTLFFNVNTAAYSGAINYRNAVFTASSSGGGGGANNFQNTGNVNFTVEGNNVSANFQTVGLPNRLLVRKSPTLIEPMPDLEIVPEPFPILRGRLRTQWAWRARHDSLVSVLGAGVNPESRSYGLMLMNSGAATAANTSLSSAQLTLISEAWVSGTSESRSAEIGLIMKGTPGSTIGNTGGYLAARPATGGGLYGADILRLYTNGTLSMPRLSGVGTRMLVVNADGDVSTQAIPGGSGGGGSKWSDIGTGIGYTSGSVTMQNNTTPGQAIIVNNSSGTQSGTIGTHSSNNQFIVAGSGNNLRLMDGPSNVYVGAGGMGINAIPNSNTHLNLAASTAAKSNLRIPNGVTPTSPVAGDVWAAGDKLYFHGGSTTYDLTAAGGSGGATTLTGDVTGTLSGTNISTTLTDAIVSTAKLANLSVTGGKIANGTITMNKLNTTGTASSSTVLHGDGVWRTVSGGGLTQTHGTYTPTAIFGGSGPSQSVSSVVFEKCNWVRIGNHVRVWGQVTFTFTGAGDTGAGQIIFNAPVSSGFAIRSSLVGVASAERGFARLGSAGDGDVGIFFYHANTNGVKTGNLYGFSFEYMIP